MPTIILEVGIFNTYLLNLSYLVPYAGCPYPKAMLLNALDGVAQVRRPSLQPPLDRISSLAHQLLNNRN